MISRESVRSVSDSNSVFKLFYKDPRFILIGLIYGVAWDGLSFDVDGISLKVS